MFFSSSPACLSLASCAPPTWHSGSWQPSFNDLLAHLQTYLHSPTLLLNMEASQGIFAPNSAQTKPFSPVSTWNPICHSSSPPTIISPAGKFSLLCLFIPLLQPVKVTSNSNFRAFCGPCSCILNPSGSFLSPLPRDSLSFIKCLAVGLYICSHQLLD